METTVKVIGKIYIPLYNKNVCLCDDCHEEINDKHGDVRHEVKLYAYKDYTKLIRIEMLCDYCYDERYGNHSQHTIFG